MRHSRRLVPIAIGSSCLIPAVAAQELPAVVVTATRTPQRVSELTTDVTVITREQIERAGHSSLAEILRGQPGLQITMNGGVGTEATVFLRGTNSDHVLVLVDGMRIASATLGTAAFQSVPPSQIERIEIVRGPASALYGADAIGGVIQIFTRAAEGAPRFRASAGYGTYHTREYTAGYGGRAGGTSFNVNAGYLESGSFSATRPSSTNFNPDRDGYRNGSVSARFVQQVSENHELGATFFGSEGRTHIDAAPRAFDHYTDRTLAAYNLHTRNRFLPAWLSTLRVGHGLDDATTRSGPLPNVFETRHNQVAWQNEISAPFGEILLAAEYLKQDISSTTNFPVRERTNRSLLAGYTGRHGAHALQANVRGDDNSQFGERTTGAIGYGYSITPQWRLTAGYGTAFKAPSFNQLYFPGFGNPALRPESARNVEAAVRHDSGARSTALVAYRNRVRDLIVNVRNPATGLLQPENVNVADVKGYTLTHGYARAGWSVRGSIDFVDAQDETSGRALPRRAKRHAALHAAREWGPWSGGVELLVSDSRFDDVANANRLGGYTLVNAFASYRYARDWSLSARVNNLFGKDYELVRAFNTAGFSAFVTLRYEPL